MRDRFFERTVVLVWHYDADGAVGIIVNRPLTQMLPDVLDVEEDVDLSPYADVPVGWGGPVDSGFGTVVTRGDIAENEGWQLPNGIAITRSQDAMFRLLRSGEPLMLCLGYAGWSAGQLEQEIALGGWLWTDCAPDLVFEGDAEERYERALASLGLDSGVVWMPPISE
jgi:putative transcriptional regulator